MAPVWHVGVLSGSPRATSSTVLSDVVEPLDVALAGLGAHRG